MKASKKNVKKTNQKRKREETDSDVEMPPTNVADKKSKKKGKSMKTAVTLRYEGKSSTEDIMSIALFPNGTPRPDADLEFGVTTKGRRRLLTAETPRVHYSGKEEQGFSTLNPMAESPKYLVGVLEGDTVTLHDASMFRMEPTIKALESIATVELTLSDREKIMLAREDLVQSFGGKKKRQAAAAETRYKVGPEALRGGTSLIKEASTKDKKRRLSEGTSDSDKGKPVPPFVKTAKKARDIYPFNKLISEKNLNLFGQSELTKALSKVTANGLAQLRSASDSEISKIDETVFTAVEALLKNGRLDLQKRKTAAYLQFLFKFRKLFEARSAKFSRTNVMKNFEDYPDVIVGVSLKTFTEQNEGKFRMSSFQKDLIVAHICVVYIHLLDFAAVTTKPVALDLGQPNTKIQEHFRAIGCTVSKDKAIDGHVATLKAPLTFPKKLGRAV
eukprot:m.87649 g.87649  ORF g.87649 m.87649 type:complete len:445 (-) comp26102_c0_seq1:51-1385(-)